MLNKALHSALKMEASNSSITGLRAHMAQEMNSAIAGATSIFLHIVANGFHFDMSCTLARGYLQAAWLPSNSWCGHTGWPLMPWSPSLSVMGSNMGRVQGCCFFHLGHNNVPLPKICAHCVEWTVGPWVPWSPSLLAPGQQYGKSSRLLGPAVANLGKFLPLGPPWCPTIHAHGMERVLGTLKATECLEHPLLQMAATSSLAVVQSWRTALQN